MEQKAEMEIRILDVFHLSDNILMANIDCQIQPLIGDFLTDIEGNNVWRIKGVVVHFNRTHNAKPVHYLNNENMLRSVSIKPIVESTKLNIGDRYYLKRPTVIV